MTVGGWPPPPEGAAAPAVLLPLPGRLAADPRSCSGFLLPIIVALALGACGPGRPGGGPARAAAEPDLRDPRGPRRTGELWTHVWATLWRVLAGFGIGAAAGIVIGALSGAVETARRLLDPTLQALRAIPSIAWVPLFILWLGIFEASKVALIAVGVFFPVYLGVAGAILSVDRKLVEVGRVFRLSRAGLARRILLPAVLPADPDRAARRASASASCSWSRRSSWARRRGSAISSSTASRWASPTRSSRPSSPSRFSARRADSLLVLATKPLVRWQDTARDRL